MYILKHQYHCNHGDIFKRALEMGVLPSLCVLNNYTYLNKLKITQSKTKMGDLLRVSGFLFTLGSKAC